MSTILNVREIGFHGNLKDDRRSPESFTLPACMTSLMEYLGEDVKWETIHAHNREYTKRRLYDGILAVTGMAFGILWHREVCPSSFDLTQVNEHNQTISYAFDFVGYSYEIVERTDENREEMRDLITRSLDAGRPVLAFGIVGPPECAIVCGYENGGDTLFGWSHFQSQGPAAGGPGGMFRIADWHKDLWKVVLCKDKKEPDMDLKEIIRRGIMISTADELSGYSAGAAAYETWIKYITDMSCESMSDEGLREKYKFHYMLVGNHAEARCYLGGFLHEAAGDDASLHNIGGIYDEIHSTCWKIWDAAGGYGNQEGYKSLRDRTKRDEIARLIRKIEELDLLAVKELEVWLQGR